jgi:glycosyltransferase involved in cell wall biosynthesis
MRVAVVAPRYLPDVGGMEAYAAWVAGVVRDTPGAEVLVLTSHRGLRTGVGDVDGVRVVRLGQWLTLSNTPISPLWPWQLRRHLRRFAPDVVNAHSPVPFFADAAVVVSPAPVVMTYHAGSLRKGATGGLGGLVDRVLGAYERHVLPRVLRRCAQLIGVSPVAMTMSTGRATLVPPGVDTHLFHPRPDPAPAEPRVVYVGRLETTSRWKGVHVLLEAFARVVAAVPDARLELVGDGDAVPGLRAQAELLGIADRIDWRGSLPRPEVAARVREAAVVVLPSLTDAESFGMVLVEGMASGVPVVGSRVGGIPFVVRDGVDGLLATPGDPVELATALERVLTEPGLAVAMGKAGRHAALERWDWQHQREVTLDVLRRAASGDTAPPSPVVEPPEH